MSLSASWTDDERAHVTLFLSEDLPGYIASLPPPTPPTEKGYRAEILDTTGSPPPGHPFPATSTKSGRLPDPMPALRQKRTFP